MKLTLSLIFLLASPAFAASPSPLLDFTLNPEAIEKNCGVAIGQAKERYDNIAALKDETRSFDNTVRAFDFANSDFDGSIISESFLKYVSTDKKIREASHACETKAEKFSVDVYARTDLYNALKAYAAKKETLSTPQKRLLSDQLKSFARNGLELPEPDRSRYNLLKKQLVEMEGEYSKNLNEVKDFAAFTFDELKGMPDDFVRRLEKTGDGKFKVTLDYPDYFPFMRNAANAKAREQLDHLMKNRGVPTNVALLDEILAVRLRLAKMLGYKTHAEYVLEERMAKDPKVVSKFLKRMHKKLAKKGKPELARMAEMKTAAGADDTTFRSWDYSFYSNQLKKKKYAIDDEKVKEYFPMQKVVDGMLELYQTVLDVNFKEIKPAEAWHADVKRFQVADKKSGKLYGHFYMDLFPRDGKYKHAAAFTLVGGRLEKNGEYRPPVSSIVANFNKPTADRPSLLKHGEVETFFHEFGHIMHQVLTRAEYPSQAGTRVARDFVEAPSQIFENWVWEPKILKSISGHYKTGKPLPDDLLNRMIEAKNLNSGLRYLGQVFYASIDQTYHDAKKDDTAAAYGKLYKAIRMIPLPQNTNPAAGFGHLMGYAASYYGYMWSEVYAQDMYSIFKKMGYANPEVGRRYRAIILERGDSQDPMELVKEFLGRAPNEAAFLENIGLK
jgi:thimet oligopeptidase